MLTMLLGEIVCDMRAFLCLMGAVVFVNAFAFHLLSPDSEEYATFGASWFSACAPSAHPTPPGLF